MTPAAAIKQRVRKLNSILGIAVMDVFTTAA
jgi:hypothetical protein